MFFGLRKKNDIRVNLAMGRIVSFGERPDSGKPEYSGKFMFKDKKEILTFGVCVASGSKLIYRAGDETDISYMETDGRYRFKGKVTDVRRAEAGTAHDFDADSEMIKELNGSVGIDKYIICVRAVTKLESDYSREFFRMPVQMPVHFREISPEQVSKISEFDLKIENVDAKKYKLRADKGILEDEEGYTEIITVDISGGGFLFKTSIWYEAEIYFECVLIVGNEALPAIGKVVKSRKNDILSDYFTHVAFVKIDESVRAALIKRLIVVQQRQKWKK